MCVGSYLWVRVRPPKDHDDVRGLDRVPLRLAALPHLLQDLHREGVGRAGRPRSRPTGPRSGSRTCRSCKAVVNALLPEAQPDGHHVADRGVPVPEARARDDVGDAAATRSSRPAAPRCASRHRSCGIEHAGGRATRSCTDGADGAASAYPCTDGHLVDAARRAAAGDGPAGAAPTCGAAADDLRYRDFLTVALVVPERDAFPDNWIYVHAPEVELGRIQNFGSWSPYMVKDGRTCLGLEYFVIEGDELVDHARRRPRRAGHARARRRSASSSPARSRPATSCACRRPTRSTTSTYAANVDDPAGAGWPTHAATCTRSAATACTSTTTRTTRCTRRC